MAGILVRTRAAGGNGGRFASLPALRNFVRRSPLLRDFRWPSSLYRAPVSASLAVGPLPARCNVPAPREDPRTPVRSPLRDPRRTGPARPRARGPGPQADQAQHRQSRAPSVSARRSTCSARSPTTSPTPIPTPTSRACRPRARRSPRFHRQRGTPNAQPGARVRRQRRQRADRPVAARAAQPGRRSAAALARLPAVVGRDHPQRRPPGATTAACRRTASCPTRTRSSRWCSAARARSC